MERLQAWRDRTNGRAFVWVSDGFEAVRTPEGIWCREPIDPASLTGEQFHLLDPEEAEALHVDARLDLARMPSPSKGTPSSIGGGSDDVEGYRKETTGKIQLIHAEARFFAIREPDGTWRRGLMELGELAYCCRRIDADEAAALYAEATAALSIGPTSEPAQAPPGYRVLVDDNWHYMDPDERCEAGVFATRDEAIAKAKEIVEASLRHHYESGMTAEDLWGHYTSFGQDPFICPDDRENGFSGWEYAREIIPRILSEAGSTPPSAAH